MLKLIAGLMLAFCLAAAPATAQSDADIDAAVDNALGDHTVYRAAFDAIQETVAEDDAAGFSEWVSYPLKVVADGEEMTIADEAQFVEHYDSIMTNEIRTAVTEQTWATLFVNYQGLMFGNGQVWLNGVCVDDTCEAFDVKVITIQSAN